MLNKAGSKFALPLTESPFMHPHKPETKEVTIVEETNNIIIIEGERWHKHDKDYELFIIKKLVGIVDKLTVPTEQSGKPIFALAIKIDNQILLMADISLAIGTPKTGIFTLIDNKTLAPNTSAVFSNQAVGANSNPEFATFALDASNNLVGTPVAAGSGTIVVTTSATSRR